jgi:hypothetical protein
MKMHYTKSEEKRFRKTLNFLDENISRSERILDLGVTNPLSEMMKQDGYKVENTAPGTDLDLDFEVVREDFDVVTAFEILEHLVSPFPLLRSVRAPKLVASVPLRLWFARAYWNNKDPFDRHYHEFETRQFHMLLNKAGWEVLKSEKWIVHEMDKFGIRPILRNFTPRYYIVYCERTK